MKRRKFILSAMILSPLAVFGKIPVSWFRTGRGFKVNAGESRTGEHIKMIGVTSNVLDIKVSSKDTDGNLTVFEQTGLTPKGGPPLHIHHFQDEMFYVIEGEYKFQVGEEKYKLISGDTIFLPRTIPHAFVQLTDKAKMILSFQPSGKMEEFFRKTATLTSPPTSGEIAKIFEDHDMQVVGPPLKVD